MSVAPKSVVSAQKRTFKTSVVTSIDPQKRGLGSTSQSLLSAVAQEPAFLKKQQERSSGRSRIAQFSQRSSQAQQTVKILSQRESIPTWLRAFIALQRYSSVATLILVSGVLVVYGSTVYTQQLWSREYRKLAQYQRQERQLTAAGEILKNQLANQAENPDTGLVLPSPDSNLFLEASPSRLAPETKTPLSPTPNPKLTPRPIGY